VVVPAAGSYLLAVTTTATVATNAVVGISGHIQIRHV
jgi:hypothetical protein